MMPSLESWKARLAVGGKFFRYCLVAGGSAVSDWSVFTTLMLSGVEPLHAQMVARIAGGVFSFLNNKFWSFGARKWRRVTVEGRRFLLLYAVSYTLSILLFYTLTTYVALKPFIAKLLGDSLIFVLNFTVMHVYVFHEKRSLSRQLARLLLGPAGRD